MSIDVNSGDVIKIVLQFLREHKLHRTLETLQEESGVSLNIVDDINRLTSDINHGKWSPVLDTVASLKLSTAIQWDLFEQIIIELCELSETNSALQLLQNSPPMALMKEKLTARWYKLHSIVSSEHFDSKEAYPMGATKDRRRHAISEQIKKEVFQIPPSRLLSIITQSLKWQQHNGLLPKGTQYDLLSGDKPLQRDEDLLPQKNTALIKFGECDATFISFSPDGQLLISGSSDGFIEIWDFDTGRLRKDIASQAKGELMLHVENESISAMTFSNDSELLATGGRDGSIKIWKIYSGVCPVKFSAAHQKAVTCLEFNRDGTQLLSASLDGSVKIHGLRSKNLLKEFRGHTSFVNSVIYSPDCSRVVSSSSDGSLKIFDVKTTDCISSIVDLTPKLITTLSIGTSAGASVNLNTAVSTALSTASALSDMTQQSTNSVQVRKAVLNPKQSGRDELFVITNSLIIYVVNCKTCKVVRTLHSEKLLAKANVATNSSQSNTFVDLCLSGLGDYLYALGEDKVLYCFSIVSGKLVHVIKLHQSDVMGIAHHPHRNILASFSLDKTLKIWKP